MCPGQNEVSHVIDETSIAKSSLGDLFCQGCRPSSSIGRALPIKVEGSGFESWADTFSPS